MSSSDQGNVLCISLKDANNKLYEFGNSTHYSTVGVGEDVDRVTLKRRIKDILLRSHSDKNNDPLLDIVESGLYELMCQRLILHLRMVSRRKLSMLGMQISQMI